MIETVDYNTIVPLKYRRRLNAQKNIRKLEGRIDEEGNILQPYRYAIGLGERHFRSFEREMERIISLFPWTRKRYIRFIMNELIINSQFSMIREVVKRVPLGKKVSGYFYVTVFVCDRFFSSSIEEFGDFFDYYGYLEYRENLQRYEIDNPALFDEVSDEHFKSLNDLAEDKYKLILNRNDELIVPDESNKIGLNIIENATDNDFYVTSFYRKGVYMWKRIYFRIEH